VPALRHLTIPWHRRNHLVSYADLRKIAQRSGHRLKFLDESQSNYSSMSMLRERPYIAAIFNAYRTVSAQLPLLLRRHLETHTIFVCQLVDQPGP
jgi:hypothetical protein